VFYPAPSNDALGKIIGFVEAPGVEPSPAFCLTINGHADLRDKTGG
jgi:hypothetical protein